MNKFRKIISNKINAGNIPSVSKLFDKIENYKVVSFDIFDTLLKRKVNNPSDVFQLMQVDLDNKISNFERRRIKAEEKARLVNNPQEITLNDIYDNFQGITDKEKASLKTLELKFERNILVANKPIVDLFNKCLNANKSVYIISDMYLPLNFVKKILSENNIDGYQEIYLSSDKKLTKKSGLLFDLFLRDNQLNPVECVHLGDSWLSDYKKPKSKGIDAIHIPKIVNNSQAKALNKQYLQNFINLNIVNHNVTNQYYNFGYQKFGPFLWGYIRWLHKNFKKEGIKKVFFFSRDGYIMKKAYDLLYRDEQDGIEDSYLEVSRRSLRVPILWLNPDFKNYINMISPSKLITIQSFFDGAGLDLNQYQDLLKKYKFNNKSIFDRKRILQNKQLKKLYSDLLPGIIQKSKKEYKLLRSYLKQEKVYGKFAIVDIGWGGSMDRYLTEALNTLKLPNNIYGYYIGVADYYKKNIKDFPLKIRGYLFDFKNEKDPVDKRSSFVGLFESLFLERDGSVKNYKYGENREIVSNRYPYEYVKNGKPTFELNSIKKIQKGAIKFVQDVKKDFVLSNLLWFDPDELFEGIRETGMQPNKEDLKLFANFHFYDEGRADKLAAPSNIIYYLINPKKLEKDFLVSRWKTGFMKKLFKIKLPYQKMYQYMRIFK